MLLIEIINHNVQVFDMHTWCICFIWNVKEQRKNVEFLISNPQQMEVLSGAVQMSSFKNDNKYLLTKLMTNSLYYFEINICPQKVFQELLASMVPGMLSYKKKKKSFSSCQTEKLSYSTHSDCT